MLIAVMLSNQARPSPHSLSPSFTSSPFSLDVLLCIPSSFCSLLDFLFLIIYEARLSHMPLFVITISNISYTCISNLSMGGRERGVSSTSLVLSNCVSVLLDVFFPLL